VQLRTSADQLQCPPLQTLAPQQSLLCMHPAPGAKQQRLPDRPVTGAQIASVQQSKVLLQCCCA
jgi:hypothetical protein